MALDLDDSSASAGNFSGALITGIVVSIIVVLLIGGLILLAALHWRKLARKVAPNKFQTPHSEKAWPKPPRKSSSDDSSTPSSNASSRAGSVRKSDPVISKEIKPISRSVTIPTLVFDQPFSESERQNKYPD
ncbi:hypothetical protein SCAR479_11184 [Seiridium cardinale]|uniref:Uncharacterized protein n=1 Tax=Seiridium cardinale TaxID=138064 RepID=A0ABR2XEQ2_9PEZI